MVDCFPSVDFSFSCKIAMMQALWSRSQWKREVLQLVCSAQESPTAALWSVALCFDILISFDSVSRIPTEQIKQYWVELVGLSESVSSFCSGTGQASYEVFISGVPDLPLNGVKCERKWDPGVFLPLYGCLSLTKKSLANENLIPVREILSIFVLTHTLLLQSG